MTLLKGEKTVFLPQALNGERPSTTNLCATCAILIGTVCVVVYGDRCEATYDADELVARFAKRGMLVYSGLVVAFLWGGFLLSAALDKQAEALKLPITNRRDAAFVMAAVGGAFGGNTILFAKAVGELVKDSFQHAKVGQGIMNWHSLIFLPARAPRPPSRSSGRSVGRSVDAGLPPLPAATSRGPRTSFLPT